MKVFSKPCSIRQPHDWKADADWPIVNGRHGRMGMYVEMDIDLLHIIISHSRVGSPVNFMIDDRSYWTVRNINSTKHQPMYSRCPHIYHDIPHVHGTEHYPMYSRCPPWYSRYPPTVLNTPNVLHMLHCTAHILYWVFIQGDWEASSLISLSVNSEVSSCKILIATWSRKFSSKDKSSSKHLQILKWLNHISRKFQMELHGWSAINNKTYWWSNSTMWYYDV